MSGREKPLILQNGMPIPQEYDKDLGDWTEYSNEHIKAIKAELALVKAELQTIKANQLSGDQKVQLSGTMVKSFINIDHGSNTWRLFGLNTSQSYPVTPFPIDDSVSVSIIIDFSDGTSPNGSIWIDLYATKEPIASESPYLLRRSPEITIAQGERAVLNLRDVFGNTGALLDGAQGMVLRVPNVVDVRTYTIIFSKVARP